MSTKNKNIKTYDLDSVFDEYMIYLSDFNAQRLDSLSFETENLKREIAQDEKVLDSNKTFANQILKLQKDILTTQSLPSDKRAKLENDVENAKAKFETLNSELTALKNSDFSTLTERQTASLEAKIVKKEDAVNKALSKLKELESKLSTDDQIIVSLQTKNNDLNALVSLVLKSLQDETQHDDANALNQALLLVHSFENNLKKKQAELSEKLAELQLISGEPTPTIETFKSFLEANGLSTAHAEEIFKYRNNPEMFEKLAYSDFKMRKMHPNRDYILKKVVAPAAVTSVGIGATIGAIAGSGLVGGSEVLGFIPVSGTPGLTEMATTLTGAVAGLAATPIVIKSKSLITRTYYKLKAKSAVDNLDDFENGTEIENLSISKLVAKIQHTERTILDSRGPKHLVLKIINRNRIHQVEAYTKELFEKYMEIESDPTLSKKVKAETLKPMYELLANIEDFISDDVAESKIHAMLTCKENKKNHHHTYMIENIDIYANLKIYIDRLSKINQGKLSRKELMKGAKKTTKNLGQKKAEAYKILNGEKVITGKLDRAYIYEQPKVQGTQKESVQIEIQPLVKTEDTPVVTKEIKTANFAPTPEVKVSGVSINDETGVVNLSLENNKEIKIPANSGIDLGKKIATAKEGKNKYSITYADGTKQEIIKKAKVLPEVETARSVLGSLLLDENFVANLKAEGYKSNTITALKEKLTEWLNNPTQKLILSGKVKELYIYSIDEINAQAKEDINTAQL